MALALHEEMSGEYQSAIATYKGSIKKFFIAIAMQLGCPTEDGNDKPMTVDALKEEILVNSNENTLLIFPESKRLTTSIRYWLEDMISAGARIEFRKKHCLACPVRQKCTRAKVNPRGLTLMVREEYEALINARQRQKTTEFKQQYSLRSGIEGTISQSIRGFNLRQCRYVGLEKTRLQHILTAAAMNLERIYAWLEEVPWAKTRISHFQKLANQKLAIA